MNSKKLLLVAAIILTSTVLLVTSTFASDPSLKLPPTSVLLVANNGTQAFFDITLSNVPPGYDVSNGMYLGWCIDRTAEMQFDAPHSVTLHSSLNPDVLADQNWTMVNYILNHKQGDREDIQQAIWYFINLDSGYTPLRPTAMEMVDDANANGTGFVPTTEQTVAVIAMPDVTFPQAEDVQISIIEVTVPISGSEPTPTPSEATPTPTPTSQPNSSPTPTPQEPDQTSPTPENTDNGSKDSTLPFSNEIQMAIAIIVALAAIVIVSLLLIRRRKK